MIRLSQPPAGDLLAGACAELVKNVNVAIMKLKSVASKLWSLNPSSKISQSCFSHRVYKKRNLRFCFVFPLLLKILKKLFISALGLNQF